jgi:hypothetical protein
MGPELNIGADRRAYLSWIEPAGDGHTLRFISHDDSGWGPVRTVATGKDWFVNWADFPSVTALADGTVAAHWLRRSGAGSYAYDIAVSFSRDGGRTWSAPVSPHDDGTMTEHGFATLLPAEKDRLHVFWLDGRNMAGLDEDSAEMHSAMTLRHAIFDAGGRLLESAELDGRTCSCCQTSAVVTDAGLLVAYRDRTGDEIRDIALLRHADGRWHGPTPVAEDGWHINACPVNGPSLDARDGQAAIAWFSGAGDDPRVQVAFADESAAGFGAPLRVDAGRATGRVDVVLTARDTALVSWLELNGDQAQLMLRAARRDGRLSMPEALVRVDPSRLSGFPRLARRGNDVLVAWTEGDAKQRRVRAEVRAAGRSVL